MVKLNRKIIVLPAQYMPISFEGLFGCGLPTVVPADGFPEGITVRNCHGLNCRFPDARKIRWNTVESLILEIFFHGSLICTHNIAAGIQGFKADQSRGFHPAGQGVSPSGEHMFKYFLLGKLRQKFRVAALFSQSA